jgi:hypothetical protein
MAGKLTNAQLIDLVREAETRLGYGHTETYAAMRRMRKFHLLIMLDTVVWMAEIQAHRENKERAQIAHMAEVEKLTRAALRGERVEAAKTRTTGSFSGDLMDVVSVDVTAFSRHFNIAMRRTGLHVGNVIDTERGYEVYVARQDDDGEDYVGVTDDITDSARMLLPFVALS